MSLLCTELHVKVHQKVQQLTQWKENITFIWHLSEHLISLSPHPERALANIWEYLGNFVLKAGTGGDVIKIVFSDQSLVKTNNQYRLNMHQTQSFLENQTNISRILLGSFTRKTREEKLFCLSQHVLSTWSIIYRWLDIQQTRLGDSGFPWKFICTFHDCSAKSVRQRSSEVEWNLRQAERAVGDYIQI